ncbi:hypothetical protein G3N96_16900 [Burkholderia sp. Se-20373]|uniref:hypothetical protein n=1 Tax=Burkholderia sp. Se-20373 TaxID=2703898 RepID=UPI00197DF61B|nr:hypothetical protein [Burkholderia sp. Se-20373]MBN3747097.1 hypothetical protein [Burkholderia sp. Se-20373]
MENEKERALYKPPTRKSHASEAPEFARLGGTVLLLSTATSSLLDFDGGLGENLRETNRLLGVDHGKNQYF